MITMNHHSFLMMKKITINLKKYFLNNFYIMDQFLLSLKNNYIIVLIAIIFTIILVFIDSKISEKKKSPKDYLKSALLVGVISTFIVYVNSLKGKIDEEIIGGAPPF